MASRVPAPTDLRPMSDDEIFGIMQGSAVESADYINGRVILELRAAGRLVVATKRLACATWALVATIALVLVAVVQIVKLRTG